MAGVVESGDPAKLDAARQRVEAELHKVAEVLYKAQAADGGAAGAPDAAPDAGPGAAGAPDDSEVVDAEYTEEKGDR